MTHQYRLMRAHPLVPSLELSTESRSTAVKSIFAFQGKPLTTRYELDLDSCRFFLYFAPLLPILSEESTPNQTFRESPLKFWVITTIGSKNCLDDPTLFSTLSPRVEALALQSLYVRRLSAYPIVEAYLLMCNFQLSTDRPSWRSVYFALSSAVIPITMQAGMHRCSNVPGFFPSLATPETERGAKLWAYAVVLNQT
jgi:hypothetical protein